jgi:hypothetical protein
MTGDDRDIAGQILLVERREVIGVVVVFLRTKAQPIMVAI